MNPLSASNALKAVLTGQVPQRRPVWFMRQAGRYLPEYRQLRRQAGSFLDLCYTPELASEATLQPLKRFDLDAAILFSDILVIPQSLGLDLTFVENEGPVLNGLTPGEALFCLDPDLSHAPLARVYEAASLTREALPPQIELLGFCGAPWTLATYMIKGGRDRSLAVSALSAHGDWVDELIGILAEACIRHLAAQFKAGVGAVQIFDSWAGDLPDDLLERYCFTPIARIVEGVRRLCPAAPVIGFAKGLGTRYEEFFRRTKVSAVSVDGTVSPSWMAETLAPSVPVQGNLDPQALMDGGDVLRRAVDDLTSALPKARHIVNLSHGVRPDTPPDHVAAAIDRIRGNDGKS